MQVNGFVKDRRHLEGIPFLLRAIQLEPRHKQALNYLGIAFQLQGDIPRAADYYRQALSIDPDYSFARSNLERLKQ